MQEFDLDAFHIMTAAGVYLVSRIPVMVFRDGYLPTMQELVGAQLMADKQQEIYEQFARTLAAKVTAFNCFLPSEAAMLAWSWDRNSVHPSIRLSHAIIIIIIIIIRKFITCA